MTRGQRHKWEEKRERTSEEPKTRRPGEDFRKEEWPEELQEGARQLGDQRRQDGLMSGPPGGRAPAEPPRETQAGLQKPPLQR